MQESLTTPLLVLTSLVMRLPYLPLHRKSFFGKGGRGNECYQYYDNQIVKLISRNPRFNDRLTVSHRYVQASLLLYQVSSSSHDNGRISFKFLALSWKFMNVSLSRNGCLGLAFCSPPHLNTLFWLYYWHLRTTLIPLSVCTDRKCP